MAVNSILEVEEATDKKGRKYYKYHVLSRAADGNEGARHQLVAATVADNKLWIVKVQVGDKRWVRVSVAPPVCMAEQAAMYPTVDF